MATTYKIQYAVSATPIEEVTLNDGADTARAVHSDIDKSVGGSKEISCSTAATNVNYKDYTTTTGYVTLDAATIYNTTITNADFLMVKIREAGSTGTPDVFIHVAGVNDVIKLSGIGDATLLRLNAIEGLNLKLKSSGATELAKVDILYGLES
jgi:hypothetical protein